MIKALQRYRINHCFRKGQYRRALDLLEPLAKKNDAQAQFLIGLVYSNAWQQLGDDDAFLAEKWFTRAAENGHRIAQLMLADLYALDSEHSEQLKRAVHWYLRAHDSGCPVAGRKLAALYLKHRDRIDVEINTAGLLYEAADQGDYKAAVLLAWMYKKGLCGFQRDFQRFSYWRNKLREMSKHYSRLPSDGELLHY